MKNQIPTTSIALGSSEYFLARHNMTDDKQLLEKIYRIAVDAAEDAPRFANAEAIHHIIEHALEDFSKTTEFAKFTHAQYLKREVAAAKISLSEAEARLSDSLDKLYS